MHAQTQRIGSRVAIVALAAIVVDQVTKLVATSTSIGRTSGHVLPVRNHEFSLGLARASLPVMVIVMAIGIVAAGAYLVRGTMRGRVPAWATGLVIGGAVSNLADRIVSGSVRDFIATPWVVLNVADLAVVVGLIGWLVTRSRANAPVVGIG